MNSNLVKAIFLGLVFSLTAHASPRDNVYTIELDWNNPKSLQDNVVQMCDDASYTAIEVTVPGKGYEDFSAEMVADVTEGKTVLGCSIKKTVSKGTTKYSLDAVNGGCVFRVQKARKNHKEKPQVAEYEISDAC